MPKVFIVNSPFGCSHIFKKPEWEIVNRIKDADLIQFTGGEDISPSLYKQAKHKRTYCNPERDKLEWAIAKIGLSHGIPMAGICRGGQLLNVLCGGSLWQDVDGHMAAHSAWCSVIKEEVIVSSIHHQLMNPHKSGDVIMHAYKSNMRETCNKAGHTFCVYSSHNARQKDPEAILYEGQKILCFQGHPEYSAHPQTTDRYFHYLSLLGFPYTPKG